MRNGEYPTSKGSTLAQDYAFVAKEVHDMLRMYFAWVAAFLKSVASQYGAAWYSNPDVPRDVWEVATQASYARKNAGDIKETTYEIATRLQIIRPESEIVTMYERAEFDLGKAKYGGSDETQDYKRSMKRNARTVNLHFDANRTADNREGEGYFDDEDTSDTQSVTVGTDDVLPMSNAELKYTIGQLLFAIETADAQPQRGRPSKYLDTLQALRNVPWNHESNQPCMTTLASTLGISPKSARERFASFVRLLTSGRLDDILDANL